ncbi:MAG: hypothetical protein ACI875_000784, partial [Planctomycetota bacterium]
CPRNSLETINSQLNVAKFRQFCADSQFFETVSAIRPQLIRISGLART